MLPSRRLLWDVKTIHGGTGWYLRQRQALDDQSGAVGVRARHIWPAYLHHARVLDVGYSPAGTTPIEDRLRSYSPTRGLVFGAYAEASLDVHMLLVAAASARAGQVWRRWGARTESEARAGPADPVVARGMVIAENRFAVNRGVNSNPSSELAAGEFDRSRSKRLARPM